MDRLGQPNQQHRGISVRTELEPSSGLSYKDAEIMERGVRTACGSLCGVRVILSSENTYAELSCSNSCAGCRLREVPIGRLMSGLTDLIKAKRR